MLSVKIKILKELKNAFPSLKNNKIPMYDCVSSNIIKIVSEEIFPVLKHMLNLSNYQVVFPENLKIVCATPIFKGGMSTYLLIIWLSQYYHVPQNPRAYHVEQIY